MVSRQTVDGILRRRPRRVALRRRRRRGESRRVQRRRDRQSASGPSVCFPVPASVGGWRWVGASRLIRGSSARAPSFVETGDGRRRQPGRPKNISSNDGSYARMRAPRSDAPWRAQASSPSLSTSPPSPTAELPRERTNERANLRRFPTRRNGVYARIPRRRRPTRRRRRSHASTPRLAPLPLRCAGKSPRGARCCSISRPSRAPPSSTPTRFGS